MKKIINFICLAILLIIAGCQQNNKDFSSQTDSEAMVQESYGLDSIKNPLRKIIRQSDVELIVKDVLETTSFIEKSTTGLNGVIEESSYSSNLQDSKSIPASNDSLLQVSTYNPTTTLRLRVPQKNLDSLLSLLPALAQHISYRTIKQSDATFDFIANDLGMQLNANTSEKIKIKKADDAYVAANFRESKISNLINNLKIDDKVAYSSVSIQLSQPAIVERQVISNTSASLVTPFSIRITESLKTGLDIAKAIFIFLISCWPFLLLIMIYLIMKRRHIKLNLMKVFRQ